MFRRMSIVFLVLVSGWTAPAVRAADEPAQPYVVLVGIDKVADPQVKTRQHAEADAKAMYDLYASKDYLGVDAKHIKLLLGTVDPKRPSEVATRANILKALTAIQKTARRDDLVVFAFFGNGGSSGGTGLLLRHRFHLQEP